MGETCVIFATFHLCNLSKLLNLSKYSFLYLCSGDFLKIKVKRDQLNRLMHEKMFNTVPVIYGQCSRNCNCSMKLSLFNLMCNCEKYRTMFIKEKCFVFFLNLCFVLAEALLECKFNEDRNIACHLFLDVA